jgi:malate dehydrogenase (oxaloacetate-decarboxylating)(NADP+)
MSNKKQALDYHEYPTPGKISIVAKKPCETAHDLSLAYSPGVAHPCLAIADDEDQVYQYTSKGNLVAVISNGTAVLGLGNIGASASKPVMEGKGVLFKSFADIDVFDIELDCTETEQFVSTVAALAPTFGGINLEDIKAPECFDIETELQKRLDIPVFHDDQHGTAIISSAALLNAIEITGRDIAKIKMVMSGAGAAAVASARLVFKLGVKPENLLMVDTTGVIYKGREKGMNRFKEEFAVETTARTLEDALVGADVFFGLSAKGLLSPEMLLSMADNPVVFAMANPDPEIEYDLARQTRPDVIMATGRSDYPNQVNNVLGFPFIFRGALDVRAKGINEEMKMAAVRALAQLAKEPVPDSVKAAYSHADFSFGPEYLIPKPFDPRVLYYVSPAVAKAAIDSGLARKNIDIEEYTLQLKAKQNGGRVVLGRWHSLARKAEMKRVVYPEGSNERVISAAVMAHAEGICNPVLLGKEAEIRSQAERLDYSLDGIRIIEPFLDSRFGEFVEKYFVQRCRKGVTRSEAARAMRQEHVFGSMLLASGEVEGLICGIDQNFPKSVRPVFEVIDLKEGCTTTAGLYIVSIKERLLFFADTTIHLEMNADKLATIAIMAAEFAESMNCKPQVALLSFSNFGSSDHPTARMVKEAAEKVRYLAPGLKIDGEMQADTATDMQILRDYPFCNLDDAANVLVFPDMQSGNISYKLLQRLGGARVIGPVLLGLSKPAHILQRHASIDEIFNMTTVSVAQASLMQGESKESANKEPVPLRRKSS